MSPWILLICVCVYFSLVFTVSYFSSKKKASNQSFFVANKSSKWYLIAFGMIGTIMSGVTFISVPGKVSVDAFSYYQYVIGNALGFFIVVFILLPLYYKLNISSIYSYIGIRFGHTSQQVAALLFLVSRTIGSATRLYLVVCVLDKFIFGKWGIPFEVTVIICMCFIWLYTFKGGLRTIILTDTLQTFFLLIALIITICFLVNSFNIPIPELINKLYHHPASKIWILDDFLFQKQHFIKQIIGGIFLTVTMVGLDQEVMQKNLSLANIKEAKKNMLTFIGIFLIINFLFLVVGLLLKVYTETNGLTNFSQTDYIYPEIALNHLSAYVAIFFILGLTAATFATTDSALTGLTTSFCIDILNFEKLPNNGNNLKTRTWVHTGFCVAIIIACLFLYYFNNDSIINVIFTIAGYTYGPLLGLFALGLYSKIKIKEKYLLLVCVLAPILCYCIVQLLSILKIYNCNFELVVLNGLLTIIGLLIIKEKNNSHILRFEKYSI